MAHLAATRLRPTTGPVSLQPLDVKSASHATGGSGPTAGGSGSWPSVSWSSSSSQAFAIASARIFASIADFDSATGAATTPSARSSASDSLPSSSIGTPDARGAPACKSSQVAQHAAVGIAPQKITTCSRETHRYALGIYEGGVGVGAGDVATRSVVEYHLCMIQDNQ